MGGGKSKSSAQVQLTPEQQRAMSAQTDALVQTFLPAYQSTIGKANDVYGQVNPAATTVAQTAMDVAQQTGAMQQQTGGQAYQTGMGGQANLAGYQQGLGQGLTGQGAGGLGNMAAYQQGLGQGMTGQGLGGASNIAGQQANLSAALQGQGFGGVGNTAAYQQGLGQSLSGQGANQLAQLFSPQFKEQQIQASMQPAREEIRNQLAGQNAMFGGAGGLGSSRQALADRNLSQLGEQRLGTVAAQTSANVEAQRQQAANTMLGTGQGAIGQAGSLYQGLLGAGQAGANTAAGIYGNIMNAGMGSLGQAQNAYGQLLGAGQGATGQAGMLYGNLAGQGASGLTAANQAASARIGYAQSPQDTLAKYAQVIYGTPQASTTPNFAGTQGQTGSSKGFGIQAPKWGG
jgi:hypothetical protein